MKMRRNLRSSLLHSERKKIIPLGLRLGVPACVLAAAILILLLSARSTTFAGSATWRLDPGSPFCPACWDYADNWAPATVPNGPADTATFDVSNTTGIGFVADIIEVNSIVFNAGASAFIFDVTSYSSFPLTVTISGVGITNNSGITQNFTLCSLCETGQEDSALRFTNDATAGDLTVFTAFGIINPFGAQGTISFEGNSTADKASVKVFDGGKLDISGHNLPGVAVGSVEGGGIVILGHNNLTVGGNDLTTTFSGLIHGGPGGSLTKVGTGTLKLTGENTYTGGTTISGGSLEVSNSRGSGTGSGRVRVAAGQLGGSGIIAGAITVGTGSGGAAILAPGAIEGRPGTLTIQSTLTFNSDATYEVGLDTRGVVADEVVANGITIGGGAFFSLLARGHAALTAGTVFTVIDNTAATPIAGTFSNLADGSTFTAGSDTFQASYEGGDGNDLTLTVVP